MLIVSDLRQMILRFCGKIPKISDWHFYRFR